jgi:hypothetical protein
MWAWIRYMHAFDSSPEFRLRKEWQDLDPHQKTILSDDLGMGITSLLLSELLNIHSYYDARRYLSILNPSAFRKLGSAKRGASKCPDFIGEDVNGGFSVLECKGTQTSHSALVRAVSDGVAQKSNVASAGKVVKHALVAGIYIPQFNHSAKSRIHLVDPTWDGAVEIIEEAGEESRAVVSAQLSLASAFYFLGASEATRYFNDRQNEDSQPLPPSVIGEISSLVRRGENGLVRRTLNHTPLTLSDRGAENVDVSVCFPSKPLKNLLACENLDDFLAQLHRDAKEIRPETFSDEGYATLIDPYGLELSITLAGESEEPIASYSWVN